MPRPLRVTESSGASVAQKRLQRQRAHGQDHGPQELRRHHRTADEEPEQLGGETAERARATADDEQAVQAAHQHLGMRQQRFDIGHGDLAEELQQDMGAVVELHDDDHALKDVEIPHLAAKGPSPRAETTLDDGPPPHVEIQVHDTLRPDADLKPV